MSGDPYIFWVVCATCGLVGQRRYQQNADALKFDHELSHPGHKVNVEVQE